MNLYTWDELKQFVDHCSRCGLCRTRKRPVMGRGDLASKIMLIAEAPGRMEDEQGIPFVGRSGQVLDELLESIGLSREQIYITNINKCHPPGNRDPEREEQEACMPYLKYETALIRPRIMVCLGRIAAQRMIRPSFSVTKEHGVFVEKGGVAFMGTFHPAALLRQPQNKPAAFADFAALREKIQEVCDHTYL